MRRWRSSTGICTRASGRCRIEREGTTQRSTAFFLALSLFVLFITCFARFSSLRVFQALQ